MAWMEKRIATVNKERHTVPALQRRINNQKRNTMNWKQKADKVKIELKQQQALTETICKRFGCGKKLSHIENLYSDYCFKHQLNDKKTQEQEKHLL